MTELAQERSSTSDPPATDLLCRLDLIVCEEMIGLAAIAPDHPAYLIAAPDNRAFTGLSLYVD
jgi:hypothetical protein